MLTNASTATAAALVAVVLAVPAPAENLLPIQLSITSAVNSQPDPPPPSSQPLNVVPFVFDPFGTNLVQSTWLTGTGCPTAATTNNGTSSSPYTDTACATGDPQDGKVQGLLLAKTGPTSNFAAAGARLLGPAVKGQALHELGYDIRKPVSTADLRGSHCGAGAPRFNITTSDGKFYFIGCNSPPPDMQTAGMGWLRLRWGTVTPLMAYNASTGLLENISGKTVQSIQIVFDEGQDIGPDNLGLAVLDNIDINGVISGRGPGSSN